MDLNKDVIPFNFKRIALNPHRRIRQGLPGRHVILPAMPGASYNFPRQFALAQRPAAMQASIIDREKLALNIRDCHGSPIHLKLPNRPSRNIVLTSSPQKRHQNPPVAPASLPASYERKPSQKQNSSPDRKKNLSRRRTLRHHHALLKIPHHLRPQTHLSRPLSQRHLIDLVLQFQ